MDLEDNRDRSERVGDVLRADDAMVAVAESATGGLIGSLLTDIPGSSDYFDRSLVTYSNEAKTELLGVTRETLETHGAVSEPTARQMARGVRELAGTTYGVSTTGVAGPGGGTAANPVGTIYIGVARPTAEGDGTSRVSVEHYTFDGDRHENKAAFAGQALTDLHDEIG
jgi:nicotinamide-nucleotide amidase